MKVFHLSTSDSKGGAARASRRIHNAILASGIDSFLLVNDASSQDVSVLRPKGKFALSTSRIRPRLVRPLRNLLKSSNPIIHSPALLPSCWPERINASDVDIVHFIGFKVKCCSGYLSYMQTDCLDTSRYVPFAGSTLYI